MGTPPHIGTFSTYIIITAGGGVSTVLPSTPPPLECELRVGRTPLPTPSGVSSAAHSSTYGYV